MANVGGTGDPCERRRPWTVLLGAEEVEADSGLAFTPAYPCGVEVAESGATTDALEVVAEWGGCAGEVDDCTRTLLELACRLEALGELAARDEVHEELAERSQVRGGRVLVSGHVQTRHRAAQVTGEIRYESIGECEGEASNPWVKLAITACGMKGPVVIDSDSEIEIPAGPVVVQVLAPVGTQVMGRFDAGLVATEWRDTSVRVLACPLDCYVPEGVLTEWFPVAFNVDSAQIDLLRPRRARRVQVGVDGLGAVMVQQLRDVNAGPSSNTTIAANAQGTFDHWGALPVMRLVSAQAFRAAVRWGIK